MFILGLENGGGGGGSALINHNILLCYHAQGVFSHAELVQLHLISHSCVNSSRLQLIV